MANDNVLIERESTGPSPQLGIVVGERVLNLSKVAVHIESSLYSPHASATLHFADNEGITGYMDAFIRGTAVSLLYTGALSYSELYSWDMVVDDVNVPESVSPRTPLGDVVIKLVPKWVYDQREMPDKIYPGVTNPTEVITSELKELGLSDDLIQIKSTIVDYCQERSFFRSAYNTKSSLGFLKNNVLPWAKSIDESPLFIYQTLSGGQVNIQSSLSMAHQQVAARLAPLAIVFAYQSEDDTTPLFPFNSRSYFSNISQENVFYTELRYINPLTDSMSSLTKEKKIDFEGLAPEVKKVNSTNRSIYFPGWRCPEEMDACAQSSRAQLLQKQTHVLAFEDYQVSTICDVGTKVDLFDLGLSVPDEQNTVSAASHFEDLHKTPMSGEYIVTASHFYFDSINEDGFNGAVLEVSKLGFEKENLSGLKDNGSFVEV